MAMRGSKLRPRLENRPRHAQQTLTCDHLRYPLDSSPIALNFIPSLKRALRACLPVNADCNLKIVTMSSWNEEQEFPLDLSCRDTDAEVNLLRGQRKLPCGICGKNFDRPSLLKRHLRTHTGEKPHGCSVCGKMFSTSSSLNTHARIHTGERPHECPICGKRFTASSNLYYHRMTHYKEKPHKCNDCGRSFPTPGDLRAHSYSHTGNWPLRCPICSRGFCKTGALHHHVQLHNGNRPYHCRTCPKKFSVASNLRAHEKTHATDTNKSGLGEFSNYEEKKSFEVINIAERSQQSLETRPTFLLPELRYPWTPWQPQ